MKMLTDADIKYEDGRKLFVVVAGHVFDVSGAAAMYGKDSGYHGFVGMNIISDYLFSLALLLFVILKQFLFHLLGQDGTRAFVTGKFDKEGLVPDLSGLTPEEHKGVSNWINFYLNHETYKFVGE